MSSPNPTVDALILAAGRGTRFGGAVPKPYRDLGGQSVLRRGVVALTSHPDVRAVRVVIHPDDRDLYDRSAAGLELLSPVPGGAARQESARLGLESLAGRAPDRVLIHDAARPFPTASLIGRVLGALDDAPAVVPALAVRDTLKRGDRGLVTATVAREGLWHAQTPQGFDYAAILAAHHRAAAGTALTDDAAVAEAAGLNVALVEGDEANLKLTTADDLTRAERRMAPAAAEVRVGTGFDVHRFGEGEGLMLCGVAVPFAKTLIGHSDSDVGLHALTDALLGAVGGGDIGVHFPPDDPRWADVASETFVHRAAALVAEAGGSITNVDVTLICEAPKIAPHRNAMIARIAEILDLEPARVSVKATSTERLGFAGRGEGIAAQAAATVRLHL